MAAADSVKFIADVMLGRLARRLRLLGFDVLYDDTLDDNAVLDRALRQDRVILTRDRALAKRPLASNHILIESDHVQEQASQVLASLRLEPRPLVRCSLCNAPLASIDKNQVRDLVPPFVYARHREFQRCSGCGKVYWKGSHVRRMKNDEGSAKKARHR
ncbi:MAG TPA: Mut7-C RNAse domain-containing protein [Nitrospirota bacterium]|nr:Mut7-C RNAse domain-containing protein [Nitrospirota bacterium]